MNPRVKGLDRVAPGTQFDAPVSGFTTFRIGGPAWAVARLHGPEQLRDTIRFLVDRELAFRVMGKGSNQLFPDEGFRGVLLLLGDGFDSLEIGQDGLFTAGAGLSLPKMANVIARHGLGGLEFSAQIPGAVGGSVAVNAGAFGQELHSRLVSVTAVNRQGTAVELPASALKGCYRTTALKGHQDLVLTSATFQAVPGDPKAVQQKQKEYGIYRDRTQPLKQASAGCVFKNPGKDCASAGALIEQLGMKGWTVGDAEVSRKHANFIVNRGQARAADVLELIARIQKHALAEAGIHLHPEIEFVRNEGEASGLAGIEESRESPAIRESQV